jgi:hypothetical protein
LIVLGLAIQTYGEALQQEQEVLMHLSDILLDTFAAESAELRAAQAAASGLPTAALQAAAASVFIYDAGLRIDTRARTLISAMLTGDDERTALAGLRRVLKVGSVNTIAERRRIANAVVEKKAYVF